MLRDCRQPISLTIRLRASAESTIWSISGFVAKPEAARKKGGNPGIENPPVFATGYQMRIDLPDGYPSVDAPPTFRFLTHTDQGQPIPHPWHPNIRYFGDFAGRVCINMPDTYCDLAWGVERVALYLHYDIYHAICEPPYPEDLKVASWVIRQAEPNGWTVF